MTLLSDLSFPASDLFPHRYHRPIVRGGRRTTEHTGVVTDDAWVAEEKGGGKGALGQH